MSKFMLAALGAGALGFGLHELRNNGNLPPRRRIGETALMTVLGFFWPVTLPLDWLTRGTIPKLRSNGSLELETDDPFCKAKLFVARTTFRTLHFCGLVSAAAAGISFMMIGVRLIPSLKNVDLLNSDLTKLNELMFGCFRLSIRVLADGYLSGFCFPLYPVFRLLGCTKPEFLMKGP